jgi:flagellar hook-length control protein FliK
LNNAAQNQQAANQSAQQAVNSISAEAKIAAPIAQTSSGQGASSGGGESSSATSSQTSAQEARETQQSSQTQSSNTNRTNGQRQAVMDQISVNITRAVNAGLDRINIQLQPESLGKVDVSLELAKDGKITAVIQAENKETLELLSRDAKELTKALQNAGLQLDEGDIAFNLSGQSDEAGDGSLADGSSAADGDEKVSTDAELAELNNIEDDDVIEDDRVNIRV